MIYGALPVDLGLIDLRPTEMMCWLYCPIAVPRQGLSIPPNLSQFRPIVDAALENFGDRAIDHYVYLTAKTLWVSRANIGNRPGWHVDGFGTEDVNYIWYDRAPTEFLEGQFTLPEDCDESMVEMGRHGALLEHVTFPCRHLLRLDPTVVHRSPVDFTPGMRTFVKVSISTDRYDLIGNSINHELLSFGPLTTQRAEKRNHPSSRRARERAEFKRLLKGTTHD